MAIATYKTNVFLLKIIQYSIIRVYLLRKSFSKLSIKVD